MEAFNDGLLKIYKTENVAVPGKMPKEESVYKGSFRFRERTVGNTKYHLMHQDGVEVKRLVRCHLNRMVSALDYVTVQDFSDGVINRYQIAQIQYPENIFPKVMDLTLAKTDWKGDANV